MPTHHPRLNVTIDPAMDAALRRLAKEDRKTLSGAAYQLLSEALERREDTYWSHIAETREAETTRWVSHEDAWK